MMPVTQKKRKLGTLVDKVNLLRAGLLVNDRTYPVLAEEDKVQLQMNNITGHTSVEPNHFYGGESGRKAFKE